MCEFRVKKIIDAISQKVNEIFGDEYNIETDEVKQGFETPCFFIRQFNGERQHFRGKRYKSNLNFEIIGFSKNETLDELNEMAENLYQIEYIKLDNGDLLRCINMNYKIEDKVLHFLFDINNFLYLEEAIPDKMENISISGEVKKDA